MEIARRARKGIEIDNPAISGNLPEEYMIGEELKRKVKEDLRYFI